jgi:hypothetical protein
VRWLGCGLMMAATFSLSACTIEARATTSSSLSTTGKSLPGLEWHLPLHWLVESFQSGGRYYVSDQSLLDACGLHQCESLPVFPASSFLVSLMVPIQGGPPLPPSLRGKLPNVGMPFTVDSHRARWLEATPISDSGPVVTCDIAWGPRYWLQIFLFTQSPRWRTYANELRLAVESIRFHVASPPPSYLTGGAAVS